MKNCPVFFSKNKGHDVKKYIYKKSIYKNWKNSKFKNWSIIS